MADPFDKFDETKSKKATPKKIVRQKKEEAPEKSSWAKKTDSTTSASSEKTTSVKKAPVKRKRRRKRRTTRQKTQVKQWSRVGGSWFMIGCGVFFLIFMWLILWWVFYVIERPEMLVDLGMDKGQIKNLLFMFTFLFVGIMALTFMFMVFLYIYRLATRKDGKLKYIMMLLLSFFLLAGTIVWWVYAYNKINAINPDKAITSNPVLTYVQTKDGPVFAEKWIPLIAPLTMTFKYNKQIFDTQIMRQIWTSSALQSVELDCGNGQILQMSLSTGDFWWRCLFLEKKEYAFTMKVTYVKDKKVETKEFSASGFEPQSVIEIDPLDSDGITLNDDKDEAIIGTAPAAVRFKSTLLFSDLKLDNEKILWDFDADGKVDFTDQASFQTSLDDSKLHKIAYQLPELPGEWSNTRFLFDLRVIESDLAWCELLKENVRDNRWRITPDFDEILQIGEYRYKIYDKVNETVVASPRVQDARGQLSYNFPEGALYEVQMTYVTKDKKKWSCKPLEISEGYNGNKAEFDVSWKHALDDQFEELWPQTPSATWDLETIASSLIPSTFQVAVRRTSPDPDASVQMFFNDRELFPIADGVYEFEVNKEGEYDLEVIVATQEWVETEWSYPVNVQRNSVEALIKIVWDIVWEDPHEIELDASVSPLYDEDDEIVDFTWDFGDGDVLTKVSQWKVKHIYRFDAENNKSDFYPKVTVHTRKWYEDSYIVQEPVVVKRKQKEVEIFMDSHPTQQAKIWEIIQMSVRTDWLVDSIKRDYWNLKVTTCESRECSNTAIAYEEPGMYVITVEVWYEDAIPAIARTKVRVY